MKLLNAFTVDVEDYFQVSAFEKDIRRDRWHEYDSRVVANTHRILKLLDRNGTKATFFVLGWIASQHPQLVSEIRNRGHEIGSHGFWHRLAYGQTPRDFRKDVQRSRDVLTNITGDPVTAYRAASFSITKQSLWALEILAEEGFTVDSSIYPIRHDRYGIPHAKPGISRVSTPSGPLWEVPPPVVRFGRLSLPVGGGGYFRLYPLAWTLRCLAGINRTARRSFAFYVHPWELDAGQPRLQAGSALARFRHRVNLSQTERKLDVLLRTFRFGRLREVIEQTASRRSNGAS